MGTTKDWHYVGSAEVNESANRIGLPDVLFEEGILSQEGRAHWAYENVVGFLVVSNRRLEEKKEDYNRQGSTKIGSGEDGYRATIPKRFFEDYEGKGDPIEEAQVEYGQTRHFVYRTAMAEGDTRSCYLLTREQLENTISTPDEWAGSFDNLPRFMRNE